MSEENTPKKIDAATVVLYLGMAFCVFAVGAVIVEYQFMGTYAELRAFFVDYGSEAVERQAPLYALSAELPLVAIWLLAFLVFHELKSDYEEEGRYSSGAIVLIVVFGILGASLVVSLYNYLWTWLAIEHEVLFSTVAPLISLGLLWLLFQIFVLAPLAKR